MAINFNNVLPWAGMRRCNVLDSGIVTAYYGDSNYKNDGSNGQVMVEIPRFWYKKVVQTVNGERVFTFAISDKPEAGFALHPAFYRDRNGDGVAEEVDKRYYAAFEGVNSGGKLESKAGVASTVNQTIATFRTQAQARGKGWGIVDFNLLNAIQTLYLVEYGHFDSQTHIGKGVSADSAKHNTGETVSFGNATGQGAGADGKRSMSYRGIENWYGNIYEWIDGCYYDATSAKIGNVNFNDTGAGYKSIAFINPGAVGYTSDLQDHAELGFIPKAFNGNAGTTHTHDYGSVSPGRLPVFGGAWATGTYVGAFCLSSSSASNSGSDIGARLAF